MNLLALQRALWVAYLAAEVLLVGTICYHRLFRRYQLFVSYLALDAIAGVLLIQLDFHSPAYAYGFRIYQIAMLCCGWGPLRNYTKESRNISLGSEDSVSISPPY